MVVDAQIHTGFPSIDEIRPYFPEHMRDYLAFTGYHGPDDSPYPKGAACPEPRAWVEDGPARVGETLDSRGVDLAILTCEYPADGVMNPYTSAEFATAVNTWQAEHWLAADERLRGSIVLPGDAELAAAEIDRWGDDPRFVQAFFPVRSETLAGKRSNHAIWRAAAEHGLAVALGFGGVSPNPPSPAGWHTYYAEEYVAMAITCQGQIMNLIAEGVLDRYPATKIVCAGCGWSWLPALMWRMDKNWKGLRREIPWVRRAPSEYMIDHLRLTLAPLDVATPEAVTESLELMGSEEMLLFSSGAPHPAAVKDPWDLLEELPAEVREKVGSGNALRFYGSERLEVEATPVS
ncbi:MAG: amidohydrolase family protein [Solirubrobacterales bacterium]